MKVNTSFINSLRKQILLHHVVHPFKLSLKAEFWESVEFTALVNEGYKCQWTPGSHGVGTDIIADDLHISNKTGKRLKRKRSSKDTVKFSSSRTTSFKTLQEKIDFLDQNHDDVIHFLTSEIADDNSEITYVMYSLPSDKIKLKDCNWETTNSGYKGTMENNDFVATISKKMSAQLWVEVPFAWLTHECEIKITKSDVEKVRQQINNLDF
jgi:hypothetical protein